MVTRSKETAPFPVGMLTSKKKVFSKTSSPGAWGESKMEKTMKKKKKDIFFQRANCDLDGSKCSRAAGPDAKGFMPLLAWGETLGLGNMHLASFAGRLTRL